MKLIFKNNNVHLPRKMKNEAKKSIEQRLSRSITGLCKTKIGNHVAHDRDYSIYSDENVDFKKIFGGLNEKTNYLAGSITSDVFFCVDIGELVWISDHFEIMMDKQKQSTIILKDVL
jgi:hypothetical protein